MTVTETHIELDGIQYPYKDLRLRLDNSLSIYNQGKLLITLSAEESEVFLNKCFYQGVNTVELLFSGTDKCFKDLKRKRFEELLLDSNAVTKENLGVMFLIKVACIIGVLSGALWFALVYLYFDWSCYRLRYSKKNRNNLHVCKDKLVYTSGDMINVSSWKSIRMVLFYTDDNTLVFNLDMGSILDVCFKCDIYSAECIYGEYCRQLEVANG